MTETLKDLMHERADGPDFAVPDLDTLFRDGDRRLRRRRAAHAVGGLAALAVVGALVVPQLSGSDANTRNDEVVAVDQLPSAVLTWASGSVLHTLDGQTDLGKQIRAYVRTDAGYVFADASGVVWSFTGGEISRVGSTSAKLPRLVSDDEDSLAGWVDFSGDRPAFVVLDQANGSLTRNDDETSAAMGALADEDDPAYFYAIDNRTAYWRDARGAVAVDLATGDVRVIDAAARNGFDVSDVENGVIAFNERGLGTVLGADRGDRVDAVVLPQVYGSMGAFSPGADYYSGDADEPQVYDARTGQEVVLDLDYAFATGYEWLDEHALVLIAQETPKSPVQLLTCQVPEGTCEVSVPDLGSFDDLASEGFALPVGEHTGE